jgi:hypothetical protein
VSIVDFDAINTEDTGALLRAHSGGLIASDGRDGPRDSQSASEPRFTCRRILTNAGKLVRVQRAVGTGDRRGWVESQWKLRGLRKALYQALK